MPICAHPNVDASHSRRCVVKSSAPCFPMTRNHIPKPKSLPVPNASSNNLSEPEFHASAKVPGGHQNAEAHLPLGKIRLGKVLLTVQKRLAGSPEELENAVETREAVLVSIALWDLDPGPDRVVEDGQVLAAGLAWVRTVSTPHAHEN